MKKFPEFGGFGLRHVSVLAKNHAKHEHGGIIVALLFLPVAQVLKEQDTERTMRVANRLPPWGIEHFCHLDECHIAISTASLVCLIEPVRIRVEVSSSKGRLKLPVVHRIVLLAPPRRKINKIFACELVTYTEAHLAAKINNSYILL